MTVTENLTEETSPETAQEVLNRVTKLVLTLRTRVASVRTSPQGRADAGGDAPTLADRRRPRAAIAKEHADLARRGDARPPVGQASATASQKAPT